MRAGDLALAKLQRTANILPQLPHLGFIKARARSLFQRRQHFHFDEDIPADAIVMGLIAQIVAVYDIAATLQIHHQGILPDDLFQVSLIMCGNAGSIVALIFQLLHLAVCLRDGKVLDCRNLLLTEQITVDLINRAETATANDPSGLPARPKNRNFII